jgi:hypothetical protein
MKPADDAASLGGNHYAMSQHKCGLCRARHHEWADAAWHATAACSAGHVLDTDLCQDCKDTLEVQVQRCEQVTSAGTGIRCGKLLGYPEFTAV